MNLPSRPSVLVGAVSVVVLASCPRGTKDLPDATASEPADAGPFELSLTLTAMLPDGGTVRLTEDDGPQQLDAPAALLLQANAALTNARVRLFDDTDRIVPSNDALIGGEVFGYRIDLLSPLRTGRTYVLALDAETGDAVLGPDGQPLQERRLELVTNGPREPDPKPPPPPRHRRR